MNFKARLIVITANLFLVSACSHSCVAGETAAIAKSTSWQWPDLRMVETQLDRYFSVKDLADGERARVIAFWQNELPPVAGPEALDHLMRVVAEVEPRLHSTIDDLKALSEPNIDLGWFDSTIPDWLQQNIRLAVGRRYAQLRFYDEALELLSAIDVDEVIDPSSLLFYRAASHHHLLAVQDCVADVTKLLEREQEVAERYTVLSKIMAADIEPLEEDSLDEVARLMNDVERRLDLGRSGEPVIEKEKTIVEKLDKLIDQIEQQIQQQMQQMQAAQQQQKNQGNGKPMDDSQIAGGVGGDGEVDPKDIGDDSGWGDLPPMQRQESLQDITKELPSHYRDVIEAYFQKLGRGE